MADLSIKKPMTLQEKLKILDSAANSINEKAGKKIVGRIGKDPELMDRLEIHFIPTPSKNINDAMGGGFPRRRMSIVAGLPDSGKVLFEICVLNLFSKKISNDLKQLGCFQAKSLDLKFPTFDIVPKELIHHFMRGYFDGDGCISGCKVMLNGTKLFLDSFVKILRENTDISQAESWNMDGQAYRWQHAAKRDCVKIYDFLYKDSTISLERKENRFKIFK